MSKSKLTPKQRLAKMQAYSNDYHKRNYRAFGLKINVNTQADVLGWIESQDNMTGAIVDLIRKDIESKKN